ASANQPVELYLYPYQVIVQNWPQAWIVNALTGPTPEQKLSQLASVAWQLQGLKDDANFVVDHATAHIPDAQNNTNHNLYPLGSSDAKRQQRIEYMRSRKAWYESQLDGLQAQVRNANCTGSSWPQACDDLYMKWRDFDSTPEYNQFPLRYIS